uniref:MAM domain-containing protein n=1 Tax=Timema douglasi TaxID=61478 RepID=A0A7R8VJ67_TIMDO|nr:unnamed protein product [Timema douglasi]
MPPGAIVRNGECRFERDTCEWLNDTQDRNSPSWRLATVSRRPANLPDKTFGAPEGYIYFDLFNQNSGSNTARLISPTVTASSDEQQLCFNFWFAAFGAGDSVELRVMRQDNSSNVEDPIEKLWVLDAKDMDTTRPKWTPAQVTVDANTDFRILLEGQATNGGFAVDDLTFSSGSCTTVKLVAGMGHQGCDSAMTSSGKPNGGGTIPDTIARSNSDVKNLGKQPHHTTFGTCCVSEDALSGLKGEEVQSTSTISSAAERRSLDLSYFFLPSFHSPCNVMGNLAMDSRVLNLRPVSEAAGQGRYLRSL